MPKSKNEWEILVITGRSSTSRNITNFILFIRFDPMGFHIPHTCDLASHPHCGLRPRRWCTLGLEKAQAVSNLDSPPLNLPIILPKALERIFFFLHGSWGLPWSHRLYSCLYTLFLVLWLMPINLSNFIFWNLREFFRNPKTSLSFEKTKLSGLVL